MKIIGLIAEYNPFHNGHIYQIKKIKDLYPDSLIIAVVSSTFTQRGEISILNKWDKTKICLDNNIDIVVELPFVYATQSSDIFAKGAISILANMNIDTLVFGTESDNLNIIKEIANVQLNNNEYNYYLKKYMNKGYNYPTATNKSVEKLTGYTIKSPNDLLALSYIKEILNNKLNIDMVNIKRTTNYHGNDITNNITSASNIRKMFSNNLSVCKYIPFNQSLLYNINQDKYYTLLKYQIINNKNNLHKYQTVDEGIENRIIKYINSSNNINDLINSIKSKRMTYNRINRMLLHILTNFTKEEASNLKIDYIRILGFNNKGQNYLHKLKKNINIPLVTAYKENISSIFDIENRITNIYSIITDTNLIEKEYYKKPIIKEQR